MRSLKRNLRRKSDRKEQTAMTDNEICFSFLVSLVITIITFVFSTGEKKEKPEYTATQVRTLLEEHVHSERDRAVTYRRMADKVKYETLAEEFQMSVRQIKKIVYRCEKIVYAHLTEQ